MLHISILRGDPATGDRAFAGLNLSSTHEPRDTIVFPCLRGTNPINSSRVCPNYLETWPSLLDFSANLRRPSLAVSRRWLSSSNPTVANPRRPNLRCETEHHDESECQSFVGIEDVRLTTKLRDLPPSQIRPQRVQLKSQSCDQKDPCSSKAKMSIHE